MKDILNELPEEYKVDVREVFNETGNETLNEGVECDGPLPPECPKATTDAKQVW